MKRNKLIKYLIIALLILSGCNSKKDESYELSGKTYYSTTGSDTKLWLAKDGMFSLIDNGKEITGNWSTEEDILTLSKIDNSGNIRFEIKDEHSIVLKSALESSSFDDEFSDDAKYASSSAGTPDPAETALRSDAIVLYNASWQQGKDKPYVELRSDGSFTFVDYDGSKKVVINGLYGKAEDGTIMFSNFDSFKDMMGNDVYNFELIKVDEFNYLLNEDLIGSHYHDEFNIRGEISHNPDSSAATKDVSHTWIHEATDQTSPEYLPKFTIVNNYSLTFEENVYTDIAKILGTCTQINNGWGCKITDNSQMMGYAGQDVDYVEFIYDSDGETLVLQNDLCMSRAGDRFLLQP